MSMKHLILFILSITLIGCHKESKPFLTVSGTVKDFSKKTLKIENSNYNKIISINDDGSFKDTLHLISNEDIDSYEQNFYALTLGVNRTFMFLKNGFNLEFDINEEKVTISGEGSDNSNYIKEKIQFTKNIIGSVHLLDVDKETFTKRLQNISIYLDSLFEKYPNLDASFKTEEINNNTTLLKNLETSYKKNNKANALLKKGKPSPQFNNYENFDGSTTSLKDFKGKHVYIDVWATWCKPCIAQIPYLKALEKKFKKKITFVSISIDSRNNKTKWKNMIQEKNMTGEQLFANGDTEFTSGYQIQSYPRFILVDPNGNIIDANALRPSDPRIETYFEDL